MGLSIAFGQEELAALADVLGEVLPTSEPDPLAELSRSAKGEVLEVARRSLRARGVLRSGDEPGSAAVAVAAARLVEVLCRPLLAAEVHLGPGWGDHPVHFAAIVEATVERRWDDGVHRLTPFATAELLPALFAAAGLDHDLAPAAEPIVLPGLALARALAAPDDEAAGRALTGPGVDAGAAAPVVAALQEGAAVAVGLVRRPVDGRRLGSEVAWLTGPRGTWWLPASVTPLGGPVGRHDAVAVPATVELVPVSGVKLAVALAEALGSGAT